MHNINDINIINNISNIFQFSKNMLCKYDISFFNDNTLIKWYKLIQINKTIVSNLLDENILWNTLLI